MRITLCKSKIHRAKVSDANLDYDGSITIDKTLMEKADLNPYEQVHVLNINNGARFITYVIEGDVNSGVICINGAAARLACPGDLVIILAYAMYNENELVNHKPKLVHVDANNRAL